MRGVARMGMLVLIGVVSAVSSYSQVSPRTPTPESIVIEQLTGGGQRVWVKRAWRQYLAEGVRQCEAGEIWTFGHNGKGVSKTCVMGLVHERQFTWAWVGTEDDLPVLKIDETRYLAELRQQKASTPGYPPVLIMILRTPRTSPIVVVEEITLTFQDM